MRVEDVILLVFLIVAAVGAGLFFLSRHLSKKSVEQQNLLEKSKMSVSIYVIDKKRDKPANVNLPKVFYEKMPKPYQMMKLYFVKAKVGPQILTLMCDKRVFEYLNTKATYKAEVAGIYISSVKGMKSAAEVKQIAKDKKIREKGKKKKEKST